MLIKVALLVGGAGLIWYAARKISTAGTAAASFLGDSATAVGNVMGDTANAVNPLNNDNVIYHTANTWTGGAPGTTLGGRIYDFFNPEPPRNTGGATGTW